MGELLPVFLIVLVPLTVHAGVLQSMFSLVDESTTVDASVTTPISGEFAVMDPQSPNIDSKAARGGSESVIADGTLTTAGVFGEDNVARTRRVNGEISVYTVREGDALSQIAEMYGVTTNTILWANDLASATDIHEGQTLVILPIAGTQHIVKSGDTISTIADKYEGDAEEILAYNQLSSGSQLSVGDTLIIPGGTVSAPAPSPTSVNGSTLATQSVSNNSTAFAHPVPGAQRTQGIHGYNGVDLAAAVGTPIRAAAAGEVIVSKSGGWNGGYGNYIVIRHPNGTQTLYAHNSSNAVGMGAYVTQGETIGYVGNTGRSTGPHVHFEVRGARNPF